MAVVQVLKVLQMLLLELLTVVAAAVVVEKVQALIHLEMAVQVSLFSNIQILTR
jgi:hypothetical protein